MNLNWSYPTNIWIGENRINELEIACRDLKIKRPLFVTDKDLVNLSFVKNIINKNKKKFEEFNIFSNFTGNPIGENVEVF